VKIRSNSFLTKSLGGIVQHPEEMLQLQLITNDYYNSNGDIRIIHSSWCFQKKEIQFVKASKRSLFRLVIGMIKKNPIAFRDFYQYLTWNNTNSNFSDARIKIEKCNFHSYLLLQIRMVFSHLIWT
jgi:hypothetical protein